MEGGEGRGAGLFSKKADPKASITGSEKERWEK